jgi:hypothetical protein
MNRPNLPQRTRSRAGVIAIIALAFAVVACRQVGVGALHVANDLSGIGRDNTTFHAYAHDAGDTWPPAGQLSIYVQGDDIGNAPAYGENGFLFLVRTSAACPMSEGAPEVFKIADVTITEVVTVRNGSVAQVGLVPDTPANRASTWALIEIGEEPNTAGGHLVRRCGTVTWSP